MARTPKAKGASVVKGVVDKVNGLEIFPDDQEFLSRIAWVESKYGTDKDTYRSGYYGGIWQVDEIAFNETITQKGLEKYWKVIKEKLGIDWQKVKYEDLVKPLYSGLAARLYLARLKDSIPTDLPSQADYWKKHYNTEKGEGTIKKFIDDVKAQMGKSEDDSTSNEDNSD